MTVGWLGRSTRRSSGARCSSPRRRAQGGQEVKWVVVGKKGNSTLRFRRFDVLDAGPASRTSRPTRTRTRSPTGSPSSSPSVRSTASSSSTTITSRRSRRRSRSRTCSPIPRSALEDEEEKSAYEIALEGDFIYEPEPEEILARLLPTYLETSIYRALLESAASKHGAQMTAMRNASKNAGELIDRLTLDMNRARQAEITQEILEVVAGADALTQ